MQVLNELHSLTSAFFGREAEETLKTRVLLAFSFIGMIGALLVSAQSVLAQAPAGPVTSPPPGTTAPAAKAPGTAPLTLPRQSILGAWTLNRDESDDPRKRMQESRGANGGGYGGRRGGGSWPGGGG